MEAEVVVVVVSQQQRPEEVALVVVVVVVVVVGAVLEVVRTVSFDVVLERVVPPEPPWW